MAHFELKRAEQDDCRGACAHCENDSFHSVMAEKDCHSGCARFSLGSHAPIGSAAREMRGKHATSDMSAFVDRMTKQSLSYVEEYVACLRPAAAFNTQFLFGRRTAIEAPREHSHTGVAILAAHGK